jgi:hypothetical protein
VVWKPVFSLLARTERPASAHCARGVPAASPPPAGAATLPGRRCGRPGRALQDADPPSPLRSSAPSRPEHRHLLPPRRPRGFPELGASPAGSLSSLALRLSLSRPSALLRPGPCAQAVESLSDAACRRATPCLTPTPWEWCPT